MKFFTFSLLSIVLLFSTCSTKSNPEKAESTPIPTSKEFNEYWYSGTGEITSYQLSQARYGELREGKAVFIYVTEPFLNKEQVKADNPTSENSTSVLKLNSVKKFVTGIYPYSVMSSTFFPVNANANQHAIKVSSSMQEWCGHVFTQLNNREQFEVNSNSYFESEGDQSFELKKEVLEDEIWTRIRINPESLPLGNLKMIPSMEYTRYSHIEFKSYQANTSLNQNEGATTYTVHYPELKRTLNINFNSQFPFEILGWTDTYKSGWGENAKVLTTTATKIETLRLDYWSKNHNTDLELRKTLGL